MNPKNALSFIRRLAKLVGIGTFILSLFLFILAAPIVNIVLGNQYQQSIIVLKILAFLPFIVGLATVYATLFLLGFGYIKKWSKIILTCSILHIIFLFIFVGFFRLAHIGWALAGFLPKGACYFGVIYLIKN